MTGRWRSGHRTIQDGDSRTDVGNLSGEGVTHAGWDVDGVSRGYPLGRTGVRGEDFESQGVETGYFQTDERAGDIPETVDIFD